MPKLTEHLVLHFDINRTIVCSDKTQLQDLDCTINFLLSKSARGNVTDDGEWVLASKKPEDPTVKNLPTYDNYLSKKYPGNTEELRKLRDSLRASFTSPNNPGAEWAPLLSDMKDMLKVDGEPCFIIPAFFQVVATLITLRQSFSIIFRTFGSDGPELIEEFNRFCVGDHAMRKRWPDLPLLDGSAEDAPDLRVSVKASFYRAHDFLALVKGTLTLADEIGADGKDFIDWRATHDNEIIEFDDALNWIWDMTSKPSVMICRDYWQYWNEIDSCDGGKLFYIRPEVAYVRRDETPLSGFTCCMPSIPSRWERREVFFDDHIQEDDCDIVDFRIGSSLKDMERAPSELWRDHLVIVNPVHFIQDINFFTNALKDINAI